MALTTTRRTAATPSETARAGGRGADRTLGPRSARTRALRRVLRNPVTVAGLVFVLILVLMALLADLLPLDDPLAMDVTARRVGPGADGHPLGTDSFGRD